MKFEHKVMKFEHEVMKLEVRSDEVRSKKC